MSNVGGRLIALAVIIFLVCLASSQCSKPVQQAPAAGPRLLSEMTPVVSVKELMASMIDPIADTWHSAADADGDIGSQKAIRTPPLMTRPSSGAQASTVHRPSAA